ncbi:short-chain dehydrogenase [Devosia yakushimensis]|uniref:Short-chain dehydrogenase n=1 Tax=Devosia yakushimensis TaxID=470028 RepID=A0ABQ5U8C0_9HYPH|nr:SDR family NAD(P)-dependent oxidoreductase [Devosia yakushimensis]GLQ08144.1 short-chain dehydrogenase [Devosia yakushimensis]
MTDKKTIAIFGAGTGLGASLAARFGHEGYRVALVARNAATLDERVAELAKAGIEAAAFPTDLNDHGAIGPLVRSIENRLGPIDVAVFAPVSSTVGFIPAQKLDAAALKPLADLFAFAPIELSHALLPGMIARGDGAIVIVGGMSAVVPMAGLSGVGPMMAAARNYIFGLHDEVKDKGVFAGTLNIGAMIDRSAGMRALTSGGAKLDPSFPVVDPDDLAEEVWTLITRRDRVEALVPPHLAG